MCNVGVSALPDDRSLLVVFDDVSWASNPEALRVVEDALSEAPVGSTAVVTTRAEGAIGAVSDRVWSVSTQQLMLTDAEIAQAWQRLARRPLGDAIASEVAAASGRHAALVSLLARHAAFLDKDTARIECTASISSLVNELVLGQLSGDDCDLLDYAAVLGEATIETLGICSLVDSREGLLRIAAALPLVSVGAAGPRQMFVVHDLVCAARGSVRRLVTRDPAGLCRIVDGLADAASAAKGLEIAIASGIPDLISSALIRSGAHLIKGASWEVVRKALDTLPAGSVAADPALLLVSAEADWVENSTADAIRQVRLAIRLAELSDGGAVPPAARLLLAGMRMALADYSGVISDLAPCLEPGQLANGDDLADMLYAAIPAYGFLADREGLVRSKSSAMELIATSGAAESRLARLEMVMAAVADLADGDHQEASSLFAAAAARPDVPQHWRGVALCDCAMSALKAGDVGLARKALDEAVAAGTAYSTPLDCALLDLAQITIDGIDGHSVDPRSELGRVVSACKAEGEAFTLAATGVMGGEIAIMSGQTEHARDLSEIGMRCAAETGSPVLMWLTELVHAQADLALGDFEGARTTAQRILPRVSSIPAMGHVLHARMILAEAALHDGDLATAVEHISAVSEHIIEKSPAFVVASYLRVFPDMLGPLALAIGVDRVPARVLRFLIGRHGIDALELASSVLTPAERSRLEKRIRAEAARSADSHKPIETDAVCRVRLFGGLEVIAPRGPVGDRDWTKRKARLLFAMLVSRFGTDVPRGEIIEYLWPEMDEERALNNFYVVWSAMKRALSPESPRETPCPFVEHVHGVCRVVPGRVVSDLDRFNERLAAARQARSSGAAADELVALRDVADLYRGEVLPGDVYDDWFAPLRERFRHEFEDAMLRAALLMEERGDPREGLSLLRRAMSHDPWREDLYQASLRLQMAAGQRSAAIETYLSCRNHLVDDLGIDPSRETTALYEQILGMEERPDC
jgi:DNA-binding SARP family transcriptional activator